MVQKTWYQVPVHCCTSWCLFGSGS